MNPLKITVDNAIKELGQLGRLTEILAAAAAVRASIEILEKSVDNLSGLLLKQEKPKKPAQAAAVPAPLKVESRKNAPAREDIMKRILAKLKKEERPMGQAELIRVLHHDYYSVAAALAELQRTAAIKESAVALRGISGEETKRKVKAYVPA